MARGITNTPETGILKHWKWTLKKENYVGWSGNTYLENDNHVFYNWWSTNYLILPRMMSWLLIWKEELSFLIKIGSSSLTELGMYVPDKNSVLLFTLQFRVHCLHSCHFAALLSGKDFHAFFVTEIIILMVVTKSNQNKSLACLFCPRYSSSKSSFK